MKTMGLDELSQKRVSVTDVQLRAEVLRRMWVARRGQEECGEL